MRFVLLILLSAQIFCSASGSDCSCSNRSSPSAEFLNYHNKQITICGYIDTNVNDTFVVSECEIINCKDEGHITDHTSDGIFKVILIKQKDALILRETEYVIDSSDKIICVPITEVIINFKKDEAVISPVRRIFAALPMSRRQKESLAVLSKELKAKIAKGDKNYGHDEQSIYLLHMGAVNHDADAIYLFKNLDSLFDLDGAYSETRGELILW